MSWFRDTTHGRSGVRDGVWGMAGAALMTAALLAGCATPQQQTAAQAPAPNPLANYSPEQRREVLARLQADHRRLRFISYPLMASNAIFCEKAVTAQDGLSIHNIYDYDPLLRGAAQELWGVGEAYSIDLVVPGSPAARAGLQPGDVVLEFDGAPVPTGNQYQNANQLLDTARSDGRLDLTYSRMGQVNRVSVPQESACGYLVALVNGDDVDAFATGEAIAVSRGTLQFVQSDHELALIVAHELSHNILNHSRKTKNNATAGAVLGTMLGVALGVTTGVYTTAFTRAGSQIGGLSYSVKFEQHADYMAMYLMRRAGFTTAGVEAFWQRMAAKERGNAIGFWKTHPTSQARFIDIRRTHQEIEAKITRGETLVPDLNGF